MASRAIGTRRKGYRGQRQPVAETWGQEAPAWVEEASQPSVEEPMLLRWRTKAEKDGAVGGILEGPTACPKE